MITQSILKKAAQQNIIQPEQVAPLYLFIQQQMDTEPADSREEPLKFVRSFGDIFITLGIILLVMAINMTSLSGYLYLLPIAGFVAIAEWLVRVRRLALPGMAILLSILYFVNLVTKAISSESEHATLIELSILSLASLLFYLRYRMPFSLLPLTASLVAMLVVLIGINVLEHPVIFVAFGVIIFAVALWFDARDTSRVSHLSDNAFWLFLLASPMIVHGIMVSLLMSDQTWIAWFTKEVLMIVFIAVIFLLALLIDRRAILISTQLYIIYALSQLLKDDLNSTQNIMIYILIGLGLFVIYFGTYWYKSRRLIFGFLSDSKLSQYIADLNTLDVKK